MKFLVCLKQVPDSTVRVKVAPDARAIVSEGITWSISPYDEYAIELALERKDADPSITVSVATVGPARAREALRQALAMGCDDATLVTGDGAESLSGLAVGRALAAVVKEAAPDIVLCGRQASDDDQGLVGAVLAEALEWSYVPGIEGLALAAGAVEAKKAGEGGFEYWKAQTPAVLTVSRSEKEPRYPSLPGIMKAKKKEIPEKALASLGVDLAASATTVTKMEPPPARGGGRILKDGDGAALAEELVRLLRDEAKVLS